jgi:hypothetical protein
MWRMLKSFQLLFCLSSLSLGGLFAAVLMLKIESTYDTELFNTIASNVLSKSINRTNQDSFFRSSMKISNHLIQNRISIFGGKRIGGLKANYIHAATVDLMTGNGACGSASVVLARILKANNFKIRIAQMKTAESWGGHIVLEVQKNNDWILLDPLFNVYFKKPNGNFASFADVSGNWDYYKKQLPPEYPAAYNYSDVRYTNWNRLGFIATPVKFLIKAVKGEEYLKTFCLRSYFLRVYHLWFLASLILFIFNLLITIWLFLKIQRRGGDNV